MQKIFYYFFSFLFFVIILFANFVDAQIVLAETCNGLTLKPGVVCSQASSKLAEFMTCLSTKDSTLVITSTGDVPSMFSFCVSNYSRQCSGSSDTNCCIHDDASCHYGGVKTDGTRDCTDGSHAIDIRANDATKDAIINKVTACGGRGFFENGNHVHASVSGCGCDGWPAGSSIVGIPYTPKPICFVPQITIPGLQLGDANAAECPGGVILSSKGDAIVLYINALYRYAAGFAGVIAMFMIVFASWQWIMASGNAGKIDNAKDTIKGALLGLTLLFTGNLLLSNITDNLVNFQSLNIVDIPGQTLDLKVSQSGYPTGQCLEEATKPYANCGVPFESVGQPGLSCAMGLGCTAGYMCWVQDLNNVGSWYACSQADYDKYGPGCQCKKTEDFDMIHYPYRLKP